MQDQRMQPIPIPTRADEDTGKAAERANNLIRPDEERGMNMEYELYNPSDSYTFLADDKETAALVVGNLSLSFGAGTQDENEENRIPIFIFGGYEEWYQEQFGRTPREGLEAKKKEVGEALTSFVLGRFKDRARYNAALQAIDDPAKLEEFKAKWQDGRSSFNDIGAVAHSIGKELLAAAGKAEQ